MASLPCVLAVDQGTTGTRAILYDKKAHVRGSAYQEFRQYYPSPGWVEHDPIEIWHSTLSVIGRALQAARVPASKIAAIGITNQRETTVLWDRRTGKAVARAIVWQDRRTAGICEDLKQRGAEPLIRSRTGLVLDPYFSGTKILWLLESVPGLRQRAARGEILFGTIDTWLLWNLTGGRAHATDATNASRTLLLNLRQCDWDEKILKLLKIPRALLPEVRPSAFSFGKTVRRGPLQEGIPICALVGDQQAALFGQGCYKKGEMKNTYGTGCFLVANEGRHYRVPPKGLLGTLACDSRGRPAFAVEGSVFIAGAAIQWLRDGLGLIRKAAETEAIVRRLKDSGGVVLIPAFTGLGAPYWDPRARGAVFGLTRGTKREHLVRAALESIAYQTADVFEEMVKAVGRRPRYLKVDGGAAANDFLMQFQADLLGVPVMRSDMKESTAWGAAKLAGLASGFWKNLDRVDRSRRYRRFSPEMSDRDRHARLRAWRGWVRRLL